jgi:hypothetical protein
MKVSAEPESILRLQRSFSRDWNDMGGHVRNLLDCMRTRNRKTVCHPENVQRSSTIAHIGNICARLGCDLEWDPVNERFVHNDEADRMLSRAMRYPWHL